VSSRDYAGKPNNFVLRSSKPSATYVTLKKIYKSQVLIPEWRSVATFVTMLSAPSPPQQFLDSPFFFGKGATLDTEES